MGSHNVNEKCLVRIVFLCRLAVCGVAMRYIATVLTLYIILVHSPLTSVLDALTRTIQHTTVIIFKIQNQ